MAEVGLVDIIETQRTSILYPVLRIATIGVGAMAGPGVLFVMPYILPLDQFVVIAAVLAIAQLMGSLGSFGLDITCPRLGIKLQWAAVYNSLSMLVASAVVFFGFGSPLTEKFILGLLIAWVGSLTAIFHSYSLFAGRARLYGVIGLAKALVFLAVLVFAIYLGVSPEIAWFLAALSGLFIAFWLLIMNGGVDSSGSNTQSGWKEVIRFSTPLAIIIAAGALPFVLDRAIAQHLLNVAEFARYTVAVTWALPVIYIGNIVQQSMIATKKDDSTRTMLFWGVGLMIAGTVYIVLIGLLSLYFVRIPYFADGEDFIRLWGWIVGWYVIYSAISFPVAAVIQKHFSAVQLQSLAYITASIAVLWLVSAYGLYANFISGAAMENKTMAIIVFAVFFAVVGVSPKIVFVYRYLTK
jgi:hypothetical protein